MRLKTLLLTTLSLGTLYAWPTSSIPPPRIESLTVSPGQGLQTLVKGWESPASNLCGVDLVIAMVLPNSHVKPDHDGEWVLLQNPSDKDIDLTHFFLTSGRRRRALDHLTIPAGGAAWLGGDKGPSLGSLRLRNTEGCVLLEDPCGDQVSSLGWDVADEGIPIHQPGWLKKQIPRLKESDEGFGGCGQT
jgi:hypothetical protein